MTGVRFSLFALLLALAAACGEGERTTTPAAAPATGTGTTDRPSGGQRDLRRIGEGRNTPDAVDLGLDWLEQVQNEDGSWGEGEQRVRATAFALLAFVARGETHKRGKYRNAVRAGFKWLKLTAQREDGSFVPRNAQRWLVDHAIATHAFCQIYGSTLSPLFKGSAQAGVDVLADEDLEAVDAATWPWILLPLSSLRRTRERYPDLGLRVPETPFETALAFYDSDPDRPTGEAWPPSTLRARAASEILARILAGEDPRKSEATRAKTAEVVAALPTPSDSDHGGIWFGTHALFQVGGDAWRTWNGAMKTALLDTQATEGDRAGSWEPTGEQGAALGRVGTTALHLTCLEVYYHVHYVIGPR